MPSLPLACDPRTEQGPLGFTPSFAPDWAGPSHARQGRDRPRHRPGLRHRSQPILLRRTHSSTCDITSHCSKRHCATHQGQDPGARLFNGLRCQGRSRLQNEQPAPVSRAPASSGIRQQHPQAAATSTRHPAAPVPIFALARRPHRGHMAFQDYGSPCRTGHGGLQACSRMSGSRGWTPAYVDV